VRARKPLGRRLRRENDPKVPAADGATNVDRRRRHSTSSRAPGVLALRRALAKSHPRVVGVDDGAFGRTDRFAPIAAVVVSAPSYVDSVRRSRVRVDGTDGTDAVLALVRSTGSTDGIRAVLLDGAVVGGFNVLDLDRIHEALRIPVVAVTRRAPDFPRIHAALRTWFGSDAERRWRLLRAHRLVRVPTGEEPILAAAVGCRAADAATLVRRTAVRGYWPEPLRLAHLVASAEAPPSRARARD
jgi:uncharacterized protein